MNSALRELLDTSGGVLGRAEALRVLPPHVVDHAVRRRELVPAFPGVYVDGVYLDRSDPVPSRTWARAALRYAGRHAALSHHSALGVWGLPGGTLDPPVHLLVPASQRRGEHRGLVVHRRNGFSATGPGVVIRSGLPVCRVEQAVVDAWTTLATDLRRAPVIAAVADRLTTADRLRRTVEANLNLPGRRELLRLIALLGRGCRSELELWGYDRVFSDPGLPAIEWNVPFRVNGRTIYLDVYCPAARLNVELDGARWHTAVRDRDRDARRDALLATRGIMVVRFTHDQLVGSPELVRAQFRAIVATRTG